VLLVLNHLLLRRGEAPTRLKAFSLAINGHSQDADQANSFLQRCGLQMLWEAIEVPESNLDWRKAVRITEDYKPLDVQAATMGLALCQGIRDRYPDWKYLVDGDGGDENLKDYPIEENSELTIRSVLNNLMLYQEGWGVMRLNIHWFTVGGKAEAMYELGHPRSTLVSRVLVLLLCLA
jgi:asparagine synthase (glutamine-hydrolysing)